MAQLLQAVSLVAATVANGLMAGLFAVFAHAVMPGLGRTDDRTFVGAFQSIDRAIINPWFITAFIGSVGFTVVAGLLHLREGARPVLPWIVAALALSVAVVVITARINVPLNNEIVAAGHPDQIADLAAVRARFEATWVRWNIMRAAASTTALGCLAWALVEHGRTLPPGSS
jgi:uncharacterized membrane protein